MNNDILRKTILNDNPGLEPNASTKSRLDYYFKLQHSREKIHSNNFTGVFNWFFSLRPAVLKIGLVTIGLYILFFQPPVPQNYSTITSDTCNSRFGIADTNNLYIDTCIN